MNLHNVGRSEIHLCFTKDWIVDRVQIILQTVARYRSTSSPKFPIYEEKLYSDVCLDKYLVSHETSDREKEKRDHNLVSKA